MTEKKRLIIDGSFGEGGGSILRLTAALSILTNRAVEIKNIRAKRKNPGLRAQHLAGLQVLHDFSTGTLSAAKIGSTIVQFHPGMAKRAELNVNIGTAGSITLVIQALQIAAIKALKQIQVRFRGGGTFVKWSPTSEYLSNVTFRVFQKMGYNLNLRIEQHGFYPKGGAKAKLTINPPDQLSSLKLTKLGNIGTVHGVALATFHLQKANVAKRMVDSCEKMLQKRGIDSKIDVRYVSANNPGCGLCIWTKSSTGAILGRNELGERGVPAEKIGKKTAAGLLRDIDAEVTCDEYLSDQILPIMALADGVSEAIIPKVTNHVKTNAWLLKQFVPVDIEFIEEGSNFLLRCKPN